MVKGFTPLRLPADGGDVEYPFLLQSVLNCFEVRYVVQILGLGRCLKHQILLHRGAAPGKAVVRILLVFPDGCVCHLEIAPSRLYSGLGRGVGVDLDDHLLVVRVVEWPERAFLLRVLFLGHHSE